VYGGLQFGPRGLEVGPDGLARGGDGRSERVAPALEGVATLEGVAWTSAPARPEGDAEADGSEGVPPATETGDDSTEVRRP
jgi:hypothetical protein